MFGKAFYVRKSVFDGKHCTEVTVCVAGAHASYLVWSIMLGNTAIQVTMHQESGAEWIRWVRPCDHSCRLTDIRPYWEHSVHLYDEPEREEAWNAFAESLKKYDPHADGRARAFISTLDDDGDSDSEILCTGRRHIRRECGEFGMPSEFNDAGPCDRYSCRPTQFRLSTPVARAVRLYLAKR